MEVINIEARTFEAMMSRFEAFAKKVEKLCESGLPHYSAHWVETKKVYI